MEKEGSKPISIITTQVANRRKLVEMLRSWGEALPLHASVEVQYTYDPNSKTRGFHLLFREAAPAAIAKPADSVPKEVHKEPKPRIAA